MTPQRTGTAAPPHLAAITVAAAAAAAADSPNCIVVICILSPNFSRNELLSDHSTVPHDGIRDKNDRAFCSGDYKESYAECANIRIYFCNAELILAVDHGISMAQLPLNNKLQELKIH
ncbi:hypothetical protein [Noviherbaspirillum album]|uniref:hypothetical protein n=1 Tax=Noviherbaspirillum album TaxID=3080276 RepID=UPI002DD6A44C|nr:hypothetical protein [Noviherbaspirillum sp. CPCC 100848]